MTIAFVQMCPVCEERRSTAANAAQWPILEAWAGQRQWPVNGTLQSLSSEEWKDILTAALLGRRTSRYGKKRFSEWLDWLNAASHHAGIKIPAPKHMEVV